MKKWGCLLSTNNSRRSNKIVNCTESILKKGIGLHIKKAKVVMRINRLNKINYWSTRKHLSLKYNTKKVVRKG